MPAYDDVPQARITILSMLRRTASSIRSSSRIRLPASSERPSRVSATAWGWSLISLAMKVSKPPFSAAAASQSTWKRLPSTTVPAKSVIVTVVGVIVATWS